MKTQLVPTTLAVSRVYVMQDIPVMENIVPVNILRKNICRRQSFPGKENDMILQLSYS
jgi:hypothetical protein